MSLINYIEKLFKEYKLKGKIEHGDGDTSYSMEVLEFDTKTGEIRAIADGHYVPEIIRGLITPLNEKEGTVIYKYMRESSLSDPRIFKGDFYIDKGDFHMDGLYYCNWDNVNYGWYLNIMTNGLRLKCKSTGRFL